MIIALIFIIPVITIKIILAKIGIIIALMNGCFLEDDNISSIFIYKHLFY